MQASGGRIKHGALLLSLLLAALLCRSCRRALCCAEQETFVSPGGASTIILQYDPLCRPTVYKKVWWGKRRVWDYPGSGFMETVHFGVEWLSESTILLTYDDVNHDEYDEAYEIAIP